jgi:predicted ATP-binding protein involved in virulence
MTEQDKSKKRSMADKIRKAEQGDILSLFEMADNYKEGRYVEQNDDKAGDYHQRVMARVNDFKLRIEHLELFQMRQFEKIIIDFEPQITLIVGNNGSGKSTIIDAVAKSLSWLVANIRKENTNGQPLDISDINVDDFADIASVVSKLAVTDDQVFEHLLPLAKRGGAKPKHVEIKMLGSIYRDYDSLNNQSNLPVIAYYSIDRSDEIKNKDQKIGDGKSDELSWNKLDGYHDALKNPQIFSMFSAWFSRCDRIKAPIEVPMARIEQLKKDLSDIAGQIESADPSLSMYLQTSSKDKQKELSALVSSLENNKAYFAHQMMEKVNMAISTFIPEIKRLWIEHSADGTQMKVDRNGVVISPSQLSQGEKSLVALIGDLARRMILLNPSRDNAFDGNGIVLIDEIDLHLHPDWQQKVVARLKATFSNIQFILTTHSPQVLSTVHKQNIRVLGQNIYGDSVAAIPLAETYGHPNSDVMATVMQVDAMPQVAESGDLMRYKTLVEQGDLASSEVIEQIKVLQAHLNKILDRNHPDMIKMEMVKRRREVLG